MGEAGILSVLQGDCFAFLFPVDVMVRDKLDIRNVIQMLGGKSMEYLNNPFQRSNIAQVHLQGGCDRSHMWVPYG